MILYYDLHIHSGLSPCADNDMSPSNIVNMACLKGLDIISVTDHNRALNCQLVMKKAEKTDLLVVPGIEVETSEGIHLVCYFETLSHLMAFEQCVFEQLPKIENNVGLLGSQIIYDEHDQLDGIENRMLINSCQLNLDEMVACCHASLGVVSLAHVNRQKSSIITSLGFIPPTLSYEVIELTSYADEAFEKKHCPIEKRVLRNSDAHQLGAISEREQYLDLEEKSLKALFTYLRGDVYA